MNENDLIRRGALVEYPLQRGKQTCDEKNANPHFLNGVASVIEFAEALPSVDAVEVVHARWIFKYDPSHDPRVNLIRIICSSCGLITGQRSNYCPCCGALMDAQTDQRPETGEGEKDG